MVKFKFNICRKYIWFIERVMRESIVVNKQYILLKFGLKKEEQVILFGRYRLDSMKNYFFKRLKIKNSRDV